METRPASTIAFLRAGETVDGKGEESKLGVYGAEELREEEADKEARPALKISFCSDRMEIKIGRAHV